MLVLEAQEGNTEDWTGKGKALYKKHTAFLAADPVDSDVSSLPATVISTMQMDESLCGPSVDRQEICLQLLTYGKLL